MATDKRWNKKVVSRGSVVASVLFIHLFIWEYRWQITTERNVAVWQAVSCKTRACVDVWTAACDEWWQPCTQCLPADAVVVDCQPSHWSYSLQRPSTSPSPHHSRFAYFTFYVSPVITGTILVWNRAVLYSAQETCTRKLLYKKPCQTVTFFVQVDLYKFLVQVSWLCVTTISRCVSCWRQVTATRRRLTGSGYTTTPLWYMPLTPLLDVAPCQPVSFVSLTTTKVSSTWLGTRWFVLLVTACCFAYMFLYIVIYAVYYERKHVVISLVLQLHVPFILLVTDTQYKTTGRGIRELASW